MTVQENGAPLHYHNRHLTIVDISEWHTTCAACGGNRQPPIDNTTASTSSTNKVPLVFYGDCSTFNLAEPHEPLEVDVSGGAAVATVLSES